MKNLAKAVVNRGGGSVVGGALSAASNKIIPASLNPKIAGIGKIVLGAVIPEFMPKSEFVKNVGAGFAGAAAAELTIQMVPALAPNAATAGIGEESSYVIEEDKIDVAGTDVIQGEENAVVHGDGNIEIIEG